ncbi:MAG: hypothetical protein E6J67_17315 [Deltaproteobacteria bacterium]|nr:MAG: hypothetical protein E6J67_17315 [Deltaproteobacteria bacterium]
MSEFLRRRSSIRRPEGWTTGPTLDPAFFSATVTMLGNGKVLVFGGEDAGGLPQSAAALFE